MDLHLEHLNRQCKGAIGHLQANITDNSVQRVGKCLKSFVDITSNFDVCSGVTTVHGHHTKKDKTEESNGSVGRIEGTRDDSKATP